MMAAGTIALPYGARLACESLAAGAVAYTGGMLLMTLAAPAVLRRLGRIEHRHPGRAAGVALGLRLLPLLAAALAAVVLTLPSYFWLEPRGGRPEEVGWLCCALALAGGAGVAAAAARLARAGGASWRYGRQARRQGEGRKIGKQAVRVLPASAPALALAGTLRPLLTISRSAWEELTPAQLELGLRHEQAHLRAGDNWKRLLLAAAPGPGRRARSLERAWARWAEWAADDYASAGDARRSLTLASALVAVARLGAEAPCARLAPCVSTFERGAGRELSERVSRLLASRGGAPAPRRWVGFAIAAAVLWLTLQPTTLMAAHAVLERLAH